MKHPGAPEVLELGSVPLPWPGDENHVLIRLKAAGVNQADAYFRSMGPYVGNGIGCILGHDGAGVVEAVASPASRPVMKFVSVTAESVPPPGPMLNFQ